MDQEMIVILRDVWYDTAYWTANAEPVKYNYRCKIVNLKHSYTERAYEMG
uniref:Uncharacterized protein n=1 Tax=Arundo donax TaxID=35708 RepID=A0A0A8ZJS0_ARUDO